MTGFHYGAGLNMQPDYIEIAKNAGIYINIKHPIAKLSRQGKDNVHPSAFDSLANFYQINITKELKKYDIEWSIEEGRKVISAYLFGE